MAGTTSTSAGGGSAGGHSSGGGGSHRDAAFFAARQLVIEQQMRYWAAGMCGLLAVFVLYHWTRRLCVKLELSGKSSGPLTRPFVAGSRLARNVLVRRIPGFKSAGDALLVAAYAAINLAITFTNVDVKGMGALGHRLGWMTLGNMLIVIFLALKNTPMKLLTGYSYERLNCLHQIAGCSMFIMMVLHAALYTAYFNGQGRLVSIYAEPDRIAGIVAGFAFLSVVFAAIVIRRWWYELFYVMHISSWIMGIIAVGFHQPDFGHKILIITILAAAMWVLDRVIRAARVLYYSSNNEVTVHPLPDGGTKVVLKKAPAMTRPGKHCFLYIPEIRKFEAHPFTVHHSQPVEFTIKARDGFTRDLHKYAVAHPGATLKASVDGPYGAFPDPMEFDKIVLIAGGGGATFTFGLAMNILERLDESRPKNVVFIWAVRKHENLSWFREQLQILKTHAHSSAVDVNLYITNASTNDSSSNNDTSSDSGADSPPVSPTTESDPEKTQLPTATTTSSTTSDVEKAIVETQSGYDTTTTAASKKPTAEKVAAGHAVQTGRPDVASLIRDAVNSIPKDKRVLVAACGPVPLMNVVRDTSARLIRVRGAGVEVHLEQFGW